MLSYIFSYNYYHIYIYTYIIIYYHICHLCLYDLLWFIITCIVYKYVYANPGNVQQFKLYIYNIIYIYIYIIIIIYIQYIFVKPWGPATSWIMVHENLHTFFRPKVLKLHNHEIMSKAWPQNCGTALLGTKMVQSPFEERTRHDLASLSRYLSSSRFSS